MSPEINLLVVLKCQKMVKNCHSVFSKDSEMYFYHFYSVYCPREIKTKESTIIKIWNQ